MGCWEMNQDTTTTKTASATVPVWVLAAGGLIFFGTQVANSIRHWTLGSESSASRLALAWSLIASLCIVIGAIPVVTVRSLKSLRSGLAWVFASGGLAFIGGFVESGIRRWVSPGFFNSIGDLILALSLVVGCLVCVVVGFIRICRAPARWYWRVLAALVGLLVISFWLYALWGILL
jgi:hypothetical protein